jgi:hypothetical protein
MAMSPMPPAANFSNTVIHTTANRPALRARPSRSNVPPMVSSSDVPPAPQYALTAA